MQLIRSSEVAEELLADEEATSMAAAKKAEKRQQQKLKKQQAKQQQEQQPLQSEGSTLQEPGILPTPVAEDATLNMLAGMSVSSPKACSHHGDLLVTSEQAAVSSGTRGTADGAFSTTSGDVEQSPHVEASQLDRAGNTRESQDADAHFMHQLLCCPISKVTSCSSLRLACWEKSLSVMS